MNEDVNCFFVNFSLCDAFKILDFIVFKIECNKDVTKLVGMNRIILIQFFKNNIALFMMLLLKLFRNVVLMNFRVE